MSLAEAVDWSTPPSGFDQIAADLRSMRAARGNPSYAELARRIAAGRAERGVPEHEQRMARSTLYDSFRDGRRRMDLDAAVEIAVALGLPQELRSTWQARLRAARAAADGASVAAAWEGMPAPVPTFVGRQSELAVVESVVQEGGSAWVTGMPGAGKTQFALSAAARTSSQGFGGIFVDLRAHRAGATPVSPAAAQRAILRLLGADETFAGDDVSRAAQLGRLLQASNRVLVLDDAADVDQVRRIVGDAPGSPVIVTSRAVPTGAGEPWRQVALHGLDGAETAALLTALAQPSSTAASVTDAEAGRLADACDGLPLAIALVGSRLSRLDGWALADHVDLMERRISEGRIDSAVRAELDLSYRSLTPAAARLLRASADVPISELGPAPLAVLAGVEEAEAASAARELVERNLATLGATGGITLHSLVRAYALDRAEETDPPAARREAFGRLALHFAERVWSAFDVLIRDQGDTPRPTTFAYPTLSWEPDAANRWLRDSLPAILAVAHEAPQRGCPDMLFRISEGLSWWMNLAGNQVAALKLHEAAADLASELGDAAALAMASLDAGQLLVHRDSPEQALEHFARARRLIHDERDMTDPGLMGVLRNMEAVVRVRLGELTEAVETLHGAVALHERLGEDARLGSALTNLAVALHAAGRYEEEAEVLERGLEHSRRTGSHLFTAYLLVNRSELRAELGDHDGATADAEATIELADRFEIPFLTITAWVVLAEVARQQGRLEAAHEQLGRALETARALGAELTVAEVLLASAQVHADGRDRAAALETLAEADSLLADDGDHMLRGRSWRIRSELADDLSQRHAWRERAIDAYVRAGAEHRADELRDGRTGV